MLLYEPEFFVMSKGQVSRVMAAEMQIYRWMYGVAVKDKTKWLKMREYLLRWSGHIHC